MAEAGANLNLRAVHEAKAGHAVEVEEGVKVVLVQRVEREAEAGQEAKAGLAVGVGAQAEARRVMCGARVGPGGPSHEVAVLKRAMAKKKKEKGAPVTFTAAVMVAVIL